MSTDYRLIKKGKDLNKPSVVDGLKSFYPYVKKDQSKLLFGLIIVLVNSAANVAAPYILGVAVDEYIVEKNAQGLLVAVLGLVFVYLVSFITNYYTIILMGRIGQRVLYRLRAVIFKKLQSLPVAFFRQNRSGDLISRINEDTEKVNLLFSQTLVRMAANLFSVIGIGIFIVVLNPKLGFATLGVSFVALFIVRMLTPLTQSANKKSLDAKGEYSAEVQENLSNFKAIIALNRRDYFISQLKAVNDIAFRAVVKANVLNTLTIPLFNFAGHITQVIVLVFGVSLILSGEVTIGLLISFLAYANRFFDPLRIMASLWISVQSALAAWRRIKEILSKESDLVCAKELRKDYSHDDTILRFEDVGFAYEDGVEVLRNVSFSVAKGETVAIIGPTGGGKSTIARLAMRLYDPTSGKVYIDGSNAAGYTCGEIADLSSFILQEPILFSGTVGENIAYGNEEFFEYDEQRLAKSLDEAGLLELIDSFPDGLSGVLDPGNEEVSLGQKQLIAFMRSLLRKPKLLILDEATANVDTVTEGKLEKILAKLPKDTSRIVIAHRLNTIKSADEIVFVSNGEAKKAVSFDEALSMISEVKRAT